MSSTKPLRLLNKRTGFADQESGYRYAKIDGKVAYAIGECVMCQGHTTEGGARQHYIDYLLAYLTKYDAELGRAEDCMVCGYGTRTGASIPILGMFPLCNDHRLYEVLHTLVNPSHLESVEE